MRMEKRNTVLGFFVLAGCAVFGYLSMEFHPLWILGMFGWLFGIGSLQFVLLRCPQCHEVAIRTRRGIYVPWTGTNCRYCSAEY